MHSRLDLGQPLVVMGFGRPRSGGAARVFADLGDMENEAKRDDGFRAPQELKPLVRPQHSKNPSRANGADFRVARKGEAPPRAPPPKRLVFGRKKFDPFAAPEVAERMAKTLKKAAKDAASTFGLGDATPRAGDAEKWAKFWEPTQRCYYFVSSTSGESRWAAHFDDDVMVDEADDGSVAYAHHATGKAATGPTEASVVEGPTIWVTLIDPVSGQVYYYSRMSGESSWAPPRWIDYYDPDARCVYYVHTRTNASTWDRPESFLDDAEAAAGELDYLDAPPPEEAKAADSPRRRGADDESKRDASPAKRPASAHAPPSHVRSPPGVNKENGDAPLDKLNAILFSYQKRPKQPWDPAATQAPADASSPEAKKRDSGASCPSPPDYVPTRKLRFGDTLVLSDDLEILD